jgi:hypothetical protein
MERNYRYYFIYKTTFKPTGQFYIGKHHADHLDDGYLGSGKRLKQLLQPHHIDCFEREILEFCESGKALKVREREIVTRELLAEELCLNLARGGGGQGPLSEETKKRIGDANRGRIHSDEVRKKNSDSHLGIKHSEETRRRMSESHKGRQYALGNVVPEEVRRQISAKLSGRLKSEETRKKMSEAAKLREAKKKELK